MMNHFINKISPIAQGGENVQNLHSHPSVVELCLRKYYSISKDMMIGEITKFLHTKRVANAHSTVNPIISKRGLKKYHAYNEKIIIEVLIHLYFL